MSVPFSGRDVVAPVAWKTIRGASTAASWRTQHPRLNLETCTGCMVCWKLCPEPAISPANDKVAIDLSTCKGCGVCANECPVDAIDMVQEDA